MPPGTPGEIQPPAEPVPISQSATPTAAPAPASVDWRHALPVAAWTGALLMVAWIVPYSVYLLWTVAAGAFGVAMYRRRVPNATLTPSIGARVGAVCGLFGFIGFSILTAVSFFILRGSTEMRDKLQQAMQESAARNPDPAVQQMMAQMNTPAGLAMLVTLGMVLVLVVFLLLGSAGGALGAKIFKGKSE